MVNDVSHLYDELGIFARGITKPPCAAKWKKINAPLLPPPIYLLDIYKRIQFQIRIACSLSLCRDGNNTSVIWGIVSGQLHDLCRCVAKRDESSRMRARVNIYAGHTG